MRRTDGSDGGAAFPELRSFNAEWAADAGMSLRDWFAGQAMTGMAEVMMKSAHEDGVAGLAAFAGIALASYALADAMLAERAK